MPKPRIDSSIEDGNVQLLELNTGEKHNPYDSALMEELTDKLEESGKNPNVKAIMLYGGNGKSFSVGGDFKEVQTLEDPEVISKWIDRIAKLYTTMLETPKPVIAGIDKFAWGLGWQIALTSDVRIGSDRSDFRMPELAHGVGCVFGGRMLSHTVGHANMQKIIYGCESIGPTEAKELGMLHFVVKPEDLRDFSLQYASKMATHPEVAMSSTKPVVNSEFVNAINNVVGEAKRVHTTCFNSKDGAAQGHFRKILKSKYVGQINNNSANFPNCWKSRVVKGNAAPKRSLTQYCYEAGIQGFAERYGPTVLRAARYMPK